MTSKHTPGPWVVNTKHGGQSTWRVEWSGPGWHNDGWVIASEFYGPDAEANANLTAAAPELYDALIEFRSAHFAWLESSRHEDPDDAAIERMIKANKRAETALKKARGEPS